MNKTEQEMRSPEKSIKFKPEIVYVYIYICTVDTGPFNRPVPVDPDGPMVIIHTSGSKVRGFDPGRGRRIFSERKNPESDFLRKGSKAVCPVS